MRKRILLATFFICGLLAINGVANATDSTVPGPFQRFNAASTYTIKYGDLDGLLRASVVNVGRSTREKAEPPVAKTGTRMKQTGVKTSTVNEGNRFMFEAFKNNEENQQLLGAIRTSLEKIPTEVPLEYFSRDEQLAYWLNLYNITVLNEIVKVYPERKLKKLLVGKKSILSKKLLTVAGVPLSLDDIQYTILKQNYNNNPLIMYGLYQGIIGGPNIRRRAYSSENVYRNLENNAVEFINSNRGTSSKSARVFRASSLYQRNKEYFADFNSDLKVHLLSFLEGDERGELQVATTIKPDINDWTVTDLYGSYARIGGSFADNNAAMIDSVKNVSVDGEGNAFSTNFSAASSMLISKAPATSRISPELTEYLHELNMKREATAAQSATVTVEELGVVPVDPDPDSDDEENN